MPPFVWVGIDLYGLLPYTSAGNRCVIVAIYHLIRHAETVTLPAATAHDVALFLLQRFLLRHGGSRELLSNQGCAFLADVIQILVAECHVIHCSTAAYCLQTARGSPLTELLVACLQCISPHTPTLTSFFPV